MLIIITLTFNQQVKIIEILENKFVFNNYLLNNIHHLIFYSLVKIFILIKKISCTDWKNNDYILIEFWNRYLYN